MSSTASYRRSTRHPWPCLLFVLPLLAAYEAGVYGLGGDEPETLRNGADHWVRFRLTAIHPSFIWLPPVLLLVVFLTWTYFRWNDRPGELMSILSGMVLESVGFAL